MNRGPSRSPLAGGVWTGSAPLWLWAAHFAFCYVASAAGCIAAGGDPASAARLSRVMAIATVVALVAGAWLVALAWRNRARGAADLMPRLRIVVAVLAWVGIAWTGLPLAYLPACG